MDLEKSDTDERYQIENPTKLNVNNIQELRECEDIEYNDTDLDHGPVHDTENAENMINKMLLLRLLKIDKIKKLMMKKWVLMMQLRHKQN